MLFPHKSGCGSHQSHTHKVTGKSQVCAYLSSAPAPPELRLSWACREGPTPAFVVGSWAQPLHGLLANERRRSSAQAARAPALRNGTDRQAPPRKLGHPYKAGRRGVCHLKPARHPHNRCHYTACHCTPSQSSLWCHNQPARHTANTPLPPPATRPPLAPKQPYK